MHCHHLQPSTLRFVSSDQFLSSPDYERFIEEGAELPALVCVITGEDVCVTIVPVPAEGSVVTFVLC